MNNISKVTMKAFDWLTQTSFPETGFAHPLDENRVKEAVKALYSFGEVFDEDMSKYLIELKWPQKAIEKVRKKFDDAKEGKIKYKDYSEAYFREYWKIDDSDLRPKEFISSIVSCDLWNGKKISWNNLKTVNILVGNNGSGKTTFLNRLCDLINGENQKKNESFLSKQLEFVINQNSKAPSFFNYRLRALDDKKNAESILKNIDDFFECVNKFFQETKKKIDVSSNPARLFFKTEYGGEIDIDQLSSGEKQLLYILLQVFLQEKKKWIVLMDEPEISLHISWQQILIDVICQMNPNCQLIIATHSPSMFGKGWGENVVFMEDITNDHAEK